MTASQHSFTVGEGNPDLKKPGAAAIAERFQAKFGTVMNGHAAETYMIERSFRMTRPEWIVLFCSTSART